MYTGWHGQSWHPEYDEAREGFSFGFLKRRDFRKYLTEDFWRAFFIWKRCRRRGLPCGGGWTEEPEAVLELLDLFDDTLDSLERAKLTQKTQGEKGTYGRSAYHNR